MIINLTPHAIALPDREIPPAGSVARLAEENVPAGELEGIQLIQRVTGRVEDLPAAEPGTYYIVSMSVRLACPDRPDLLSPGDLVRDEGGRVVGCKNLVANGSPR